MSKRVAAKKMLISRDTYRKMKSYDHKQMCDFLESFYRNGFEDGKKVAEESAVMNLDKIKEVIQRVKGIGPARAQEIVEALRNNVN